jgi:hypothetical protein
MGDVALGIAFSPTGNMKEELEYLKSKTTKWAERIKTAHLTHIEAWTALKTTIFKTIEYALPATLLSEKEMKAIVSPALNIGLSKAGICQKIARHIIYSPEKYQGFGLKDPYVTQGIKKLQLLFTPSNILTTQLISESWNRAKVESGIGPNMLRRPFAIYKDIITPGWISNLWEFVSTSHIDLVHTNTTNPFRISQDNFLTKQVFTTNTWTKRQKIDFNSC